MPVISMGNRDLEELVGHGAKVPEMTDRLELIGAVIERREIDSIDVEVFPDRPDLFSVEGFARALRSFLGLEPGLRGYDVMPPTVELRVDPSVLGVRPVIACAVVRNIVFDDDSIASLMDFQEKLHLTVGRRRRKVSIGVHDMRRLKPPYTYKGVEPRSLSFMPLQGDREMDLQEILEEHPKGVDYAWILEGMERYPLIVDAEGQVLSFPPIINGTVTQVEEDTSDLFLDVTGLDEMACRYTLRILATMLAERGGAIEAVRVSYPDRTVTMPDLEPERRRVPMSSVVPWTGIDLDASQAAQALRLMGYDADATEDGSAVDVLVPAYRMDVLHDVDVAEDVAIGFGYDRVRGTLPEVPTLSVDGPTEDLERRLHAAFQGRGLTEVVTLALSSLEEQYERMRLPVPDDFTEIANPHSENHATLRTHLVPDLLAFLGANTHHDYPQEVYEVGHVVVGQHNRLRAAAVSAHAKAGFTQAKSLAEGVLRDLGLEATLTESPSPSYVPGRCAQLSVGGQLLATFGELHPEVLEAFGLVQPAIALELDLETLL